MFATRRKVIKTGKYSKCVVIPAQIKTGKTITMAGGRLILIDPRGEIPEDQLLDLLEKFVEPQVWRLLK